MRIHFVGANRQVTGSRYLLEVGGMRLQIDCGMFQEREYLPRNWETSPIPPEDIDFLLLTHAHLDHCGLLPRLVQRGFDRPIYATPASIDLAEIILKDAAKIQVEDARHKRKRHRRENRKREHEARPLYTPRDVPDTMALFRAAQYHEPVKLSPEVAATWHDAGHILGSAILEITARENGEQRTVIFSGDVGQADRPILRDPELLERADYVVCESTYGGREHESSDDVDNHLAREINDTVERGGNILIPTFAVERAQELIYHLGRLVRQKRIPQLMCFLDSPMAVDVTDIFREHRDCMDDEAKKIISEGKSLLRFPGLKLVRSSRESRAINTIRGSCVIMAGSGMCTAGRIKHHLIRNINRPESTVLFVGYQAHGTLGRQIVQGDKEVRILGNHYPVKARVSQVLGLSAHADHPGLIRWLSHFKPAPRKVFLTHGEEDAARALAADIDADIAQSVEIPEYQSTFELD